MKKEKLEEILKFRRDEINTIKGDIIRYIVDVFKERTWLTYATNISGHVVYKNKTFFDKALEELMEEKECLIIKNYGENSNTHKHRVFLTQDAHDDWVYKQQVRQLKQLECECEKQERKQKIKDGTFIVLGGIATGLLITFGLEHFVF